MASCCRAPYDSKSMASIFLCHASEDKPTVEPIQLALAGAGHRVFFDEQSLPPGGDYHQRIRNAIATCDLFVFIGSEASLKPGKFTLSELKFARERWPSPVNHVLPVVLGDVEPRHLPPYLQATTVLSVDGNAAAEVRGAVEDLAARLPGRTLRRWGSLLAAVFVVAAGLGIGYIAKNGQDRPVNDAARFSWTAMTGQLTFQSQDGDFIGDGKPHRLSSENGVITANVKEGAVSISFEGDDSWTAEFTAPRQKPLTVGNYPNAQRTPFNNPLKPGMSVSGAGRGCNEIDGEFTIERIVAGPADRLRDLRLSFRQRCDGGQGELTGTIEIKSP